MQVNCSISTIFSTFVVPFNSERRHKKSISKMAKTFTLHLTAEQLVNVQVALLEADLTARADRRHAMARAYMDTYKYIGTEKRRAAV